MDSLFYNDLNKSSALWSQSSYVAYIVFKIANLRKTDFEWGCSHHSEYCADPFSDWPPRIVLWSRLFCFVYYMFFALMRIQRWNID